MNKWFYFNSGLLIVALWQIFHKKFFTYGQMHLTFGLIALLFYLFNWTRHAVFSTIRSTTDRQRKIKYANLSKRVVHIHKWTGTMALIMALVHAFFTLKQFNWTVYGLKMFSGIVSILLLTVLVISGWFRYVRPTIFKRYLHLFLGMGLFFSLLVHLFL